MPVTVTRVRSIHLRSTRTATASPMPADVIRTTLVITNTGTSERHQPAGQRPARRLDLHRRRQHLPARVQRRLHRGRQHGAAGRRRRQCRHRPLLERRRQSAQQRPRRRFPPRRRPRLHARRAPANLDTAHGTVNIFADGSFNYISARPATQAPTASPTRSATTASTASPAMRDDLTSIGDGDDHASPARSGMSTAPPRRAPAPAPRPIRSARSAALTAADSSAPTTTSTSRAASPAPRCSRPASI